MSDSTESSVEWWQRESFDDALRDFRESLKVSSLGSPTLHMAWIRLALLGHISGRAGGVAQMVHRLMSKLHQGRHALWGHTIADAACIIHFKLATALAEDESCPKGDVVEFLGFFEEASQQHAVHSKAVPLLRLAVLLRLGELKQAAALFPGLYEWWQERDEKVKESEEGNDGDEADPEDEKRSSPTMPVCVSGTAQILIEYLLAAGGTEEALSIADRLLDRKGCQGFCEAGPHSAIGWILRPMLERGEVSRAGKLVARGRLMAPATDSRFVGAVGDRLRFFVDSGQTENALAELDGARRAFGQYEAMPSGWQQLRFAGQLAAAGDRLWSEPQGCPGGASEVDLRKVFVDEQIERGRAIANAFDRRNGNDVVSSLWPTLSAREALAN